VLIFFEETIIHRKGAKGAEGKMRIRPLVSKDREKLHSMVVGTGIFAPEEIDVAMELIDIVLKVPNQKDYLIVCIVSDEDIPLGYLCYGLAPMTQGTIDLYWIVVSPSFQGKGVGSKLVDYLEEVAKGMKGRMILAETSSIPSYQKTLAFYVRNGFKEEARVLDYYSPGNDRITFCKRISGR
jgi:ribosomal protein S18 acetylase RimI-like enzyme